MEPAVPLVALGLLVVGTISLIDGRRKLAWTLIVLALIVLYVGAWLVG